MIGKPHTALSCILALHVVACGDDVQSTSSNSPTDAGLVETKSPSEDGADAATSSERSADSPSLPGKQDGGATVSDAATTAVGDADVAVTTSEADADAQLEPDASAATRPDVPPPEQEKLGGTLGRININLATGVDVDDVPYASIDGRIYASPKPNFNETWEATLVEGECQLVERRRVECSEECVAPASCAEGGICAEEPPTSDMGQLRVWGLSTKNEQPFIDLELLPTGTYVLLGDSLQYLPFTPGDQVVFEASGGASGDAFVVGVRASEPLELASTEAVPFETDTPVTLNWKPGTVATAKMFATVDISFHGGKFGQIRCATDDDGELTISAEMVTRLIDLGVAGFPHVELARRSEAFVNRGQNHVEFNVVSNKFQLLSIPGVRSCTEDTQCEDGETCQSSMCR